MVYQSFGFDNQLQHDYERIQQAEEELEYRVAFEALIIYATTHFINLPLDQIDEGINQALRAIGNFEQVDRSYIFLFSEDRLCIHNTHEWCAEGIAPQIERLQNIPVDSLPWFTNRVLRGEVIHIPRVADLPPEAENEKHELEYQQVQSLIVVPMIKGSNGRVYGFLGFDAVQTEHTWSDEGISLLKIIGQMFVNALQRKHIETAQEGQRQFLEMLATGKTLSETLHALVTVIEEQAPGMHGLILLLDDTRTHLHYGAAISLPEEYLRSLEGLEIGPMVGSCGTAAYCGQDVIVEDIATDPRWESLRDLALAHGLRACWSKPVVASTGQVIGTFALYYSQARGPDTDERQIIETAAYLAGIAIERNQIEDALKESELNLKSLLENATNFAVYRVAIAPSIPGGGEIVMFSTSIRDITGLADPHDMQQWTKIIHPEDLPRLAVAQQQALFHHQPLDVTVRIYHTNRQQWIWIHTRATPGFDSTNRLTHFNGIIVDVTEQKQSEEALRESERRLSTLMSNLPGMAYRCRGEPGWPMDFASEGCLELTGYTPAELIAYQQHTNQNIVHPEDRQNVHEGVQAAVHAHQPFKLVYRIITASGEEKWLWNHGRGVYDSEGNVLALEGFATDITERVMNELLLERRVEERTNELSTLYTETSRRAQEMQSLLAVQQALTSKLDPDAVLHMIADEARRLTNATFSTVFLLEDNELCLSTVAGSYGPGFFIGYRMPVQGSATGLSICTGGPVRIDDAIGDHRTHPDAIQRAGISSMIAVPLLSDRTPLGAITVGHNQPAMFDDDDEQVLAMLAPGAVIALQNARHYREEQQRRREIEALYRADEELYRYLNLEQVFQALVDVVVDILHADKSALLVCQDERLVVQAARGFCPETLAHMSFMPGEGVAGQVAVSGQPVVIEDTSRAPDIIQAFIEPEHICSFMDVPITINSQVFGVFNVSYTRPRVFGDDERRLVVSLAQRAALAIENARFHEQAQQAAALEERQHLARELHDAVTQTLFSASLVADVLPKLWERKPEEGRRRLQELRQLTRGALAEMRTLLLELRPATLLDSGMGDLLRQLAEAFAGRTQVAAEVEIEGDWSLPSDVKVVFYRIAQEALNNISKHARATAVQISLTLQPGHAHMSLSDNGRGFDTSQVATGRLGLSIMRERAEAVEATVCVESTPGEGTRVTVTWEHAKKGDSVCTTGGQNG
jgi:PAS domain S-box-containing protein